MFNFFSRRKKITPDPRIPVTVDLHSHLLPALDDGVETEEESLQLIRAMADLGYRKFITTPHIYPGSYNNSEGTIRPALVKLQASLSANRISVSVEAAAEYFFDEFFIAKLSSKELLTFGGDYVLFELAFGVRPVLLEKVIFQMNVSGYKPVLAHPERYSFFYDRKLYELEKLKDTGIFFQLNIMSLSNQYGNRVRDMARALIDQNMIDFAGSDLHRAVQLPSLSDSMKDKYFFKLLDSGKLLNETL